MVKPASSFSDLLNLRFTGQTNAACWQRSLPGDYAEVIRLLGPGEGVVPLDEQRLRGLRLGARGKEAVETMLADLHLLREAGRDPVLNIIYDYPKDEEPSPIPTDLSAIASATAEASANRGGFARDVYSWHVDSAPIEADTWLCTYHGACSEALNPEDAVRKVDDPALRARLLTVYGGRDDQDFAEWLSENHYDLHYSARPGANPIPFGHQNLWRLTCAWPDSPVPPCVHRAPVTSSPRLLLIS